MKTKLVDTVVGNEEYVRLRIFDGEFTPDDAYEELLRIEKEQRKSERLRYDQSINSLINLIRTFSPNKGKKMNVTPNTGTNGVEVVRHYYIDADGKEVELPFDLATDSDGEAAPEETTVYVATDEADHPVTVH